MESNVSKMSPKASSATSATFSFNRFGDWQRSPSITTPSQARLTFLAHAQVLVAVLRDFPNGVSLNWFLLREARYSFLAVQRIFPTSRQTVSFVAEWRGRVYSTWIIQAYPVIHRFPWPRLLAARSMNCVDPQFSCQTTRTKQSHFNSKSQFAKQQYLFSLKHNGFRVLRIRARYQLWFTCYLLKHKL